MYNITMHKLYCPECNKVLWEGEINIISVDLDNGALETLDCLHCGEHVNLNTLIKEMWKR